MLTGKRSREIESGGPLVTAILLCYNQARFVEETLESVKAQTYRPLQVILIDDCSQDDSVARIERWRSANKDALPLTFVVHAKNMGICKSLNEALRLAEGKYISMLASDDVWLPDKTAREMEILEAQAERVGVAYTDAFQMDTNSARLPGLFIVEDRKRRGMLHGKILDALLEYNFIPGPTVLIRRSCFEKVGGFDENLAWEDWDMWLRIARQYEFYYSAEPSVVYRIHDGSFTRARPLEMRSVTVKIYLKQLTSGGLTDAQRLKARSLAFMQIEQMYALNEPGVAALALALWQATGFRTARRMYWFAKVGAPYSFWERVKNSRLRLSVRRALTVTRRAGS